MALLEFKSNAQIDEEKARTQTPTYTQPTMMDELAGYILNAFEAAKYHRQTEYITDRFLSCQRQKKGVYDPVKMAAIERRGGSKLYFNITDTKAEALEAWIQDILIPSGDKPWSLSPTPIPDLGDDSKDQIAEELILTVEEGAARGQELQPEDIMERAAYLYDEALKREVEVAKEKAERMEQKMADQLVEGGFHDALDAFKQRLSTFPSAIIKGPVIRLKKRLGFEEDPASGIKVPTVVQEEIPTWCAPSPQDLYPGPNATSIHDTYICEVVRISKQDLSDLRGVDGYSTKAIEAVLNDTNTNGLLVTLYGNDEREDLEDRDSDETHVPDSHFVGVEYWGPARGSLLKTWGMKGIEDDNRFYEICALLIGNYVVKSILNPNPLGMKPYYFAGFINNPDSIWGTALPEKMKDCQDMVNACGRNLADNIAIAAGPQVAVDLSALAPGVDATKVYPMRVWQYYGDKTAGRKPVEFFQPSANANELLGVMDAFEQKADDRTMVPRYTYGGAEVGGAGETASGLSMLMGNASKGIKRLIGEIDRLVLRPLLHQLYVWNMLYLDNEKYGYLKGDAQIIPKGALAMLLRDQTLLRQQEFLNVTNNPTDLQIMGMEGRAMLLRKVAQRLEIDPDKLIPDPETLRQQAQAAMQEQGAEPEAPAEEAPAPEAPVQGVTE